MRATEAVFKDAESKLAGVGFDPASIIMIISILISLFKLCKSWKPKNGLGPLELRRLRRRLKKHGIKGAEKIETLFAESKLEDLNAFVKACRRI